MSTEKTLKTGQPVLYAALETAPITLEPALAAVCGDEYGAAVGFAGVVRDHDGGRPVRSLSYFAHPSAERVLQELTAELARGYAEKPAGVRIWVAHRLGELKIGDPALVCAVAAAHRSTAFTACAELVDRIKTEVPIWKEQFFSDGTVEWVAAGRLEG